MNRVVMGAVLAGLSLLYGTAAGMEFGHVRLHSAPDQPLQAEVMLHPRQRGELDGIQVRQASADEYRQAGLDPARAALPLSLSLQPAGHGRQRLQISSSAPLPVPYLDLLLVVSGPHGRSLHEVPLVLNPSGRHAVAAARVGHAAGGLQVHLGQTLSSIALQQKPAGVSLDQMLLAYQRLNPQAFYADNISALKAGAILRVPTRRDAEAISRAEAFRAVEGQNQAWHAGRPHKPSLLANAGAAPAAAAPAAPAPQGDRLTLLAGKGQPAAGQALQLSQEALHSSQQQAADLSSRIEALQQMQQERSHLIALKNQQIAHLQQQLQSASSRPPAPAAAPTAATRSRGWYELLAALGVLLLWLLGYVWRRRRKPAPVAAAAPLAAVTDASREQAGQARLEALQQQLRQHPEDTSLYLQLASLYYERHDISHFEAIAEAMFIHVTEPNDPEWRYVLSMGRELLPAHPLFAPLPDFDAEPPAAAPASPAPVAAAATAAVVPQTPPPAPVVSAPPAAPAAPAPAPAPVAEPVGYAAPDLVDTHLDLARAYLDMGNRDSAKAMLEEVLVQGSQMQKDVARQLLDGLDAD